VVWVVVGGQDGFQEKANCPPLDLDLNLTHYLTKPQAAGNKPQAAGKNKIFKQCTVGPHFPTTH